MSILNVRSTVKTRGRRCTSKLKRAFVIAILLTSLRFPAGNTIGSDGKHDRLGDRRLGALPLRSGGDRRVEQLRDDGPALPIPDLSEDDVEPLTKAEPVLGLARVLPPAGAARADLVAHGSGYSEPR